MLPRIGFGLALTVLLVVAPAYAQSPEDAAQKSVEPWLALVDSGQYAASWEQAATAFKKAVTAAQWEQASTHAREPFGPLVSRKVKSRTYSTTAPGAPDGRYVQLLFDTAFERKASAVEQAMMVLEPDGAWRATSSADWRPRASRMTFVTRQPPPPLDRYIRSIWFYRCAPRAFGFERVLPNGSAQLIVNLKEDLTRAYDEAGHCQAASGAVVSGLGTRFQIIDTAEQEHVIGVSFHPAGTVGFFREPAHEFNGPDVPVDALWGAREAARLREALLEARTPDAALDVMERALVAVWRSREAHPAVGFALATFLRRPDLAKVRAVTDAVGLSPKRFIERFKAGVGVTPKQYCRVLRFQRAITQTHAARPVDWTDVALASGYYDQAHFIHDFRAFSGLTPTGYLAGRTAFQNHVTFLQSDSG